MRHAGRLLVADVPRRAHRRARILRRGRAPNGRARRRARRRGRSSCRSASGRAVAVRGRRRGRKVAARRLWWLWTGIAAVGAAGVGVGLYFALRAATVADGRRRLRLPGALMRALLFALVVAPGGRLRRRRRRRRRREMALSTRRTFAERRRPPSRSWCSTAPAPAARASSPAPRRSTTAGLVVVAHALFTIEARPSTSRSPPASRSTSTPKRSATAAPAHPHRPRLRDRDARPRQLDRRQHRRLAPTATRA